MVAVPFWLSLNVTPAGSGSASVRVAVGEPVEETVKLLPIPTVKVSCDALVISGAVCASTLLAKPTTSANNAALRAIARQK